MVSLEETYHDQVFDYDALIMEYIELDVNANKLISEHVPKILTRTIQLPILKLERCPN